MLDQLFTFDAILHDLWRRLSDGAASPKHPFHTACVANANEDVGVRVRTVVVRKADPEQRVLMFHTDRRSGKFANLLQDPNAAWLFYDEAERLQIRVSTTATLHTQDAVAQEQWAQLAETSRSLYTTPLAPGTVLDTIHLRVPEPREAGRDHFGVVRCAVDEIDWLYLHPDAHRRARFRFERDRVESTWLAP